MLSIVAISDSHSMHEKILGMPESGDILIHSGDVCGMGRIEELEKLNTWLGGLKFKHKIIVPGNHDKPFVTDLAKARFVLSNATVLLDEEITIEGVRIYGSPWTPTFGRWSFMKQIPDLKEVWDKIPSALDILITHGPPKGILDEVMDYSPSLGRKVPIHVGCPHLANRVEQVKPKYHIFGHIHEGYGSIVKDGITYINASINDERYSPINKATIFGFDNSVSKE